MTIRDKATSKAVRFSRDFIKLIEKPVAVSQQAAEAVLISVAERTRVWQEHKNQSTI